VRCSAARGGPSANGVGVAEKLGEAELRNALGLWGDHGADPVDVERSGLDQTGVQAGIHPVEPEGRVDPRLSGGGRGHLLPDQLFYDTGISTYFWVLGNRKHPARRGKVQLLDAREGWVKMRKSLGNKRGAINEEQIAEITRLRPAAAAHDVRRQGPHWPRGGADALAP
jgi:hypothetical protein